MPTVADAVLIIELPLTNDSIPLSDDLRARFDAFREGLLDESETTK